MITANLFLCPSAHGEKAHTRLLLVWKDSEIVTATACTCVACRCYNAPNAWQLKWAAPIATLKDPVFAVGTWLTYVLPGVAHSPNNMIMVRLFFFAKIVKNATKNMMHCCIFLASAIYMGCCKVTVLRKLQIWAGWWCWHHCQLQSEDKHPCIQWLARLCVLDVFYLPGGSHSCRRRLYRCMVSSQLKQ